MITKLVLLRALLAAGAVGFRSDRPTFSVRVSSDVDDDAPWDRWSALEAAGCATAFQSRAFVEPLTRRLAPALGAEPFVVEVADGDGPMLAAAFVRRRIGDLRVVEFADLGYADYAAPIFRRGMNLDPAAAAAIEAAVRKALPPHDALFLRKMPDRVDGEPNPFALLAGARPVGTGPRVVDLGAADVRDLGVVRHMRTNLRRLERRGGTIRRLTTRAEALAALDRLFALREVRSAALGEVSSFARPEVRAFYRAVVGTGVETGFAPVYEVDFEGEILAVLQGFAHRGRFNVTLVAFDVASRAAKTYSPGLVTFVQALLDHADAGGAHFDLGPGEHAYKERFGGTIVEHVELLRAGGAGGVVPVVLETARREARAFLRDRPALRDGVRRLRGR